MAISSADHGAPYLKVKTTSIEEIICKYIIVCIKFYLEIYLEFQADKFQPELM